NGKTPVGYASISIPDLRMGTSTDETGAFVLKGVPVGVHDIQFTSLGYGKSVQKVTVVAGQTALVNFVVGEQKSVKELETIEVRAEKRIDTKSSTTKQSISAEKLKEIHVDNLSQADATNAGEEPDLLRDLRGLVLGHLPEVGDDAAAPDAARLHPARQPPEQPDQHELQACVPHEPEEQADVRDDQQPHDRHALHPRVEPA